MKDSEKEMSEIQAQEIEDMENKKEDPRITQARKLMIEVDKEEFQLKKKERQDLIDSMVCTCGHLHKYHTPTYSINYTAGFCIFPECKCRHFIKK